MKLDEKSDRISPQLNSDRLLQGIALAQHTVKLIAHASLQNPVILILDEAISALDRMTLT